MIKTCKRIISDYYPIIDIVTVETLETINLLIKKGKSHFVSAVLQTSGKPSSVELGDIVVGEGNNNYLILDPKTKKLKTGNYLNSDFYYEIDTENNRIIEYEKNPPIMQFRKITSVTESLIVEKSISCRSAIGEVIVFEKGYDIVVVLADDFNERFEIL